mmetsp:Transcript_3128/g.3006  ORF Transcript_3128/g.3006 Transcript_3128/m.3006 type:complete len:148 (+) Transcript_3128:67-510(+)
METDPGKANVYNSHFYQKMKDEKKRMIYQLNLKEKQKRDHRYNMKVYSRMVKEVHPPKVSSSKQEELRDIMAQRLSYQNQIKEAKYSPYHNYLDEIKSQKLYNGYSGMKRNKVDSTRNSLAKDRTSLQNQSLGDDGFKSPIALAYDT